MTNALPPIAPEVLAAAVEVLPGRLRKKLDATVTAADGWQVQADGAVVTVRIDQAVAVTLTPDRGLIRSPEQATCSCLLAPKCLHRAAVLSRAPVADIDPPAAPDAADVTDTDAATEPATGPAANLVVDHPAEPAPELTAAQQAAVTGMARAGAAVIEAGLSGTGTILRANLLRWAYEARACGLYRGASLARRVATHLQAATLGEPQFRLADLLDDLRELLWVCRALQRTPPDADAAAHLIGTARRRYQLHGSLRLYGLCAEPVIARSGYAGVTTYLVDRDGQLWAITDVAPGGPQRAAASADATVRLGEAASTHRALTRRGLVVSGATASTTRQLGAGGSVRAVDATGAGWWDEPLTRLWGEPLEDQARRAFAGLAAGYGDRAAGSDLLFLTVTVVGARAGDLVVALDDGVLVRVTGSSATELPVRRNLHVLAGAPGARYRLVCRPDPRAHRTVDALALAPEPQVPGSALPEAWGGHAELGFDHLHSSHLPAVSATATATAASSGEAGGVWGERAADQALQVVRRHVERAVTGGRAVAALARPDDHQLRGARLETAAAVVRSLATAARSRPRDAFGRLADDDGVAFAQAWLALAVYEAAAARAQVEAWWCHPSQPNYG